MSGDGFVSKANRKNILGDWNNWQNWKGFYKYNVEKKKSADHWRNFRRCDCMSGAGFPDSHHCD